jgi:DNA primase
VSLIPDETIEQVRDSADIVGIIGESVDLKRTGSDYRGPCPFHGGTHRNFSVIPKKGRYYCFVCHASGDVFTWLMKRTGMDYPTAIREVARRTGIVIPERPGRAGPDPLEPLFGAVAAAHDWFTRQLLESPDAEVAREYLRGRDLSLETAAIHGLGFAPPARTFLPAMQELGIKDEVLLQTGLSVKRDDGTVIPRFRARLLFPIHDLRGRVAGFGGRLLGPGEPKYLNSPETPIFHKGKQLYNMHQAKGAIRKEETVILVEGYFDVLRLVIAGVDHVVAPLGTALTDDQAALLRRYAPSATLLYDSDTAGLRATFRAGDELLRHGVRVRVATLPPGEDPDTLVKSGGTPALDKVLGDAIDVLERKIQLLEARGWFEGMEHQREALDRLLPTIRAASDPITRDLYIKAVSEQTGVSRDALQQELAARPSRAGPARGQQPSGDAQPPQRAEGRSKRRREAEFAAERDLLRVIMRDREWLARAVVGVPPDCFETPAFRELYEAMRQSPENVGSLLFLEQLSPRGRQAWQYLDAWESKYGTPNLDATYDAATRTLQARPLRRGLLELARRKKVRGLSSEEFDAVIREERRLKQELASLFPEELLKRSMRRGRLDAR